MRDNGFNKFRAAMGVLQRGRDQLADSLADDVLDQGDELLDNVYTLNEFLETQGTRLHFLTMVLAQLEASADSLDERLSALPRTRTPKSPASTPPKKRTRVKKPPHQGASADRPAEDV